jgi:hypothetical protein
MMPEHAVSISSASARQTSCNSQDEEVVKYLLLLYDDTAAANALTVAERRSIVDEHIAFSRMLEGRGAHVYSDPLDDPAGARTIRFDSGSPIVTDGPFLEAKEALGGFYVLDCTTEADAIELAKQTPRSPGLVVELLPIADM